MMINLIDKAHIWYCDDDKGNSHQEENGLHLYILKKDSCNVFRMVDPGVLEKVGECDNDKGQQLGQEKL